MQVIEFAHRLDAKIAAERLNLQNSLLISLLAGNLTVETGSTATASAANFYRENFLRRLSSTLQIKGKKRHILVDTLGLLLHAIVHPADVQDRDGGILVMSTLFGMFPFLKKLFADGGYQGPQFEKALAKVLPHLNVEIVKRSDRVKGFVVLPQRWIVERTIAWLNRCRRLAKDWENRNRKALAFLRLASIRLMLRKLCNPA
jgi:transposase